MTVFSFFVSCSKDSGDEKAKNEVTILNMAYNPVSITVPANTNVTWTNNDDSPHTVTSNTGLFTSGMLNKGMTFSYKFTSAGIFQYYCTLHPNMTGTIIVQ